MEEIQNNNLENEPVKSDNSKGDDEKLFKEFQNVFWGNEECLPDHYDLSQSSIISDILTEPYSFSGESGLSRRSIDLGKIRHFVTPPDCSLIDITQIKQIRKKKSDKGLLGRGLFHFPKLKDPGLNKSLYKTLSNHHLDNLLKTNLILNLQMSYFSYHILVIEKKYPKNGQSLYLDICTKLGTYSSKKVFDSLLTNSIDLKFYGLDPRTVRAIAEALELNTNIIELNLQDNYLSSDAMYHIGKMLIINNTLRILNLKSCRIGAIGAERLAVGLLENDTIRALDLSHNQLEDSGIELLKSALILSFIVYLNLSFNQIGDLGAAYIGEILEENDHIEELNLSWNYIFNPGAIKELLKGLKKNSSLKKFNISYNAISIPDFGKRMKIILCKSYRLEHLDISGNRLNGKTTSLLIRGFINCETLRHVKIGNNPIDPISALELIKCLLEPKTTIKIMDLSNIWVNKEFNQIEARIKELKDCEIIIGGIYSNYEIIGPDEKRLILERATIETMLPKKKKLKRDFGIFVLKLPNKPIKKPIFQKLITKEKLKLSQNLIKLLIANFLDETKKVDTLAMKEYYLKIFPDTELPEEELKERDKSIRDSDEEEDVDQTVEKKVKSEDLLDFQDIFGSDYYEYGLDDRDFEKLFPILWDFEEQDIPFNDTDLSLKSLNI